MKGFLFRNKKWFLLIPYIAFVAFGWFYREQIYTHFPAMLRETWLGTDMLLNLCFCSLAFAGLVCLIQLLRVPLFKKRRVDRTFRRANLKNANAEYPVLAAVHPDFNKPHGKIYTIINQGIPIDDFDKKVHSLEAGINGKIYLMEYTQKATRTLLYVLPRKYVRPSVITLEDYRLCREPNMLVVGKTGSGKSYALSMLLGIYARFIPGVRIVICDYKKSSFAQFSDTPNFYGYEDVPDGIRTFYKEFSERLAANDPERNKHTWVLLIDEYGALISAQEKKTADELKTMVANMLFMGRSLGIHILVGVQRADAEHFKAGARDQFRAILALGNLSKEQKAMLFTDYKESMTANNGTGEGYLLIDGQDIEQVKIAKIPDMDALNASIRAAML